MYQVMVLGNTKAASSALTKSRAKAANSAVTQKAKAAKGRISGNRLKS
jgi:hypothetical protein